SCFGDAQDRHSGMVRRAIAYWMARGMAILWRMSMRFVLVAFWVSFAANVAYAFGHISPWMPLAVLGGWYAADLASGVVHLYMDYKQCPPGVGLDQLYFYSGNREGSEYLDLRRRVLARINPFHRLVYDFKNHHPRPDALGRRSMLVQVGSTVAFGTLPVSLLVNLWCWAGTPPDAIIWAMVSFLPGATFAQYFHGTLHRTDNPAIIGWMRRFGLLMTPRAHQKHHDSLKRDFATNCGWSNPLLNPLFNVAYRRGWVSNAGLEPTA
ncbi:MAG: fatty acid desaturase CarF family protein, partial [Sphingobium sp.]